MKRFLFLTIILPIALILNVSFNNSIEEHEGSSNHVFSVKSDQDEDVKCLDCHSDLIGKDYVHYPASESCEDCHIKNNESHPDSDNDFSLAEKGAALCYICHDNINTKKNIHYPIEDGDCMICHSPHSSENASLLIESPTSKLCVTCHDPEKSENKMVHKPYEQGDCAKCHDPHHSDQSSFLKKKTTKLCVSCHKDVGKEMKSKNVHAPADEDCLNCHRAHVSDEKHLFDKKVPRLCYSCHEQVNTKKNVHAPVEAEECNSCHSPHASSHSGLLLSKEIELCLTCHEGEILKDYNFKENAKNSIKLHGAIEMDGCKVCHDPHSSDHNSLFVKKFPAGLYAPAETENFALCFECHESDLINLVVTDSKTGFRNGSQNLHYVHINGEKGRSCVNCHDIHGSVNDHLIAEMTMFGNWEMKLKYTSNENGGTCSTGCHGTESYKR